MTDGDVAAGVSGAMRGEVRIAGQLRVLAAAALALTALALRPGQRSTR